MFHKLQYETIPKLLELNHQPLKVYLALCEHADLETGVCWPGYKHLKKECKIHSGSEMKAAIEKLVEEKLIGTWMEGIKRYYQVLR